MANLTLARRDSYLEFLRGGVKPDTLTALHTAPVHLNSLFPDSLLVKAEDEILRRGILLAAPIGNQDFSLLRFLKWQINTTTGPEAHYTGLEAN